MSKTRFISLSQLFIVVTAATTFFEGKFIFNISCPHITHFSCVIIINLAKEKNEKKTFLIFGWFGLDLINPCLRILFIYTVNYVYKIQMKIMQNCDEIRQNKPKTWNIHFNREEKKTTKKRSVFVTIAPQKYHLTICMFIEYFMLLLLILLAIIIAY